MASIMNDRDASYVITRNNRPVRVILNYDKAGSLSEVDLSQGVREMVAPPPSVERKIAEPGPKKEEEDHSISALTKKDPDYFKRFRKLYEPMAEPPPPPPTPPKNEPVVRNEAVKKDPPARELATRDLNDDFPAPPAPEPKSAGVQRLVPPASSNDSQSLDLLRSGREPPSIQDLLRELEQEKLSGEDDNLSPLNSSDLRRLFHDIS